MDKLVIPSDKFTWRRGDDGKNAGSAELSDLSDVLPDRFGFPLSLIVRSVRTGQTRLFLADERIPMGAPADNEIGGVVYVAPAGAHRLTLWND